MREIREREKRRERGGEIRTSKTGTITLLMDLSDVASWKINLGGRGR